MIAGDKLSFLLRSLTIRAALERDFDKLPIPFRTVATVVQTGDIYVFSRGNVADAIRASMSVPGVFAPVEVDGKILTDGGTVQNLPVSANIPVAAAPRGGAALSRTRCSWKFVPSTRVRPLSFQSSPRVSAG